MQRWEQRALPTTVFSRILYSVKIATYSVREDLRKVCWRREANDAATRNAKCGLLFAENGRFLLAHDLKQHKRGVQDVKNRDNSPYARVYPRFLYKGEGLCTQGTLPGARRGGPQCCNDMYINEVTALTHFKALTRLGLGLTRDKKGDEAS